MRNKQPLFFVITALTLDIKEFDWRTFVTSAPQKGYLSYGHFQKFAECTVCLLVFYWATFYITFFLQVNRNTSGDRQTHGFCTFLFARSASFSKK